MESVTLEQISRDSAFSFRHKVARVIWNATWLVLFRPSPKPLHFWRRFLLRLFGAEIGQGARPYPSSRIWAPWNLVMRKGSCLGENVDCYTADQITIGCHATVSQRAFLCTATHDFEDPNMTLMSAPIVIEDFAWVCAEAFVGMGVVVGQHAVVGARAAVFRDVATGTVVGGNPARVIRHVNRRRVA